MIEDELNQMWQEMTGSLDKRLGIAAVITAAMIWHHDPCERTADLLHKALTYLSVITADDT